MTDTHLARITRLGAQGDGIADCDGRQIFVPFTLAGEHVEIAFANDRANLVRVLEPSADRVAPVCRHFGICGGCAVQHLAPAPYAEWKRALVVDAFASRGLTPNVEALVQPGGKRRRVVISIRNGDAGPVLGFHEAGTHNLVAIEECPVSEQKIVVAFPAIATLIAPLVSKRGEARVTITSTAAGLDIDVQDIERKLTPDIRTMLAREAARHGFARLVVAGEIVVETLNPFLRFGSADVGLPPGVFVQAVAAAESEIASRIVSAVGKAKTVADLFSGMGAFSFPLALRAKVSAFDGSKAAIAALGDAVRKTQGLKPISATVRDLFRDPLSSLELNEHDAVVFDPPRAGADAQAQRMARSKVKTIVAISCNPATLARDARHLVDGGYSIESVATIDQFVYAPHVEAVSVFRR
jgi:23S rRNA (uracil1939-C5)-methyltransferase